MTYYVSRGTLNPTHSLTHSLTTMRTKMNSLDFKIKTLKVKVTTRPSTVNNLLLGPFCHHGTLNDDNIFELDVMWMVWQF